MYTCIYAHRFIIIMLVVESVSRYTCSEALKSLVVTAGELCEKVIISFTLILTEILSYTFLSDKCLLCDMMLHILFLVRS